MQPIRPTPEGSRHGSHARARGLPALPALLALAFAGGHAWAQNLPPAATPGGALPVVPLAPLSTVSPEDLEPFPIPPAVERPLEVDSGERLFVTGFQLKGVTDHPEQGITREGLETMLEEIRRESLGLSDVDASGFTGAEQRRISEVVREMVDAPPGEPDLNQLQWLLEDLRSQRIRREAGMTIGQIQEMAALITERYRKAGFILAQAFVPAQEVEDGLVVIEVFEGKLGTVVVEGNDMYADAVLARPFEDLIDMPVTATGIETALLTSSDYPGVAVFGVFQPGTRVGETDLVVRVQNERRFDASVRFDNYGTEFTGRYRAWVDAAVNNVTGGGDRLYGAYLRQFDPTNGRFWQVEYTRPMFTPDLVLGVSAQRNPFDVGGDIANLGLAGESEIYQVFLDAALVRSRQKNAFANVTWRRSNAVTTLQGIPIAEDVLSVLETRLSFDSIDSRARAINLGDAGMTIGLGDLLGGHGQGTAETQVPPPSRVGASGQVASNNFFKAFGSYSRLQKLHQDVSLLLRTEAQWSPSLLTSLEQFNIGGPASVRAFPVAEALADTGVFGSLELTVNAPWFAGESAFSGLTWGEILRVSFFTDFAWGELNDPLISDRASDTYSGYGAGLSFGIPGSFQGRVQYATPFGSQVGIDGSTSRWWFDLTYQF